MCIALISTAHPQYQLILLDNRDEFINRPTAQAEWWPQPDSKVLGGRDLLRAIQGTWLGVTSTGKIAVLTNYREDTPPLSDAVSRGAIIRKFLTEDVGPMEDFVAEVVNTGIARDAGGFSLVCGHVGEKLAIVSNRVDDSTQVPWIAGQKGQTVGLSNTHFGDRSWKKVTLGEELMLKAIKANSEQSKGEDQLIESLLEVLSHDTLPRTDSLEGGLETHMMELRNSIFVPPLGKRSLQDVSEDEMRRSNSNEPVQVLNGNVKQKAQQLGVDGIYATQKQTVVLVDHDFNVRFVERTFFDQDTNPVPTGEGDVDIKFKIER